jgi:mRNA interferase MazF
MLWMNLAPSAWNLGHGALTNRVGPYDDWLICMVSSQLHHHLADFDEIIDENSPDFVSSGLKRASVIRIGRLAVVEGSILLGAIGTIAIERLQRIKTHLADWLSTT